MGLVNPSATMGEIVTTTLRNRSGELADNYTNNNALLARLRRKGNVKPFSGGRTIVQEMAYAQNGTFKRYSGYEPLNIAPSDVFTAAEFNIAQAAVAITISGLEGLMNAGAEEVLDLLEERITNGVGTLTNGIASDVYSDGTADGGRQIGGLQLLVGTNPNSGTVGGIDRSSTIGAFWRNKKFSGVTDGGAPVSETTIQRYMNKLYLACCRGNDRPDLIVADNNFYEMYWASLQAIQRMGPETSQGEIGFESLKYKGADVIFDGGIGGAAPTNQMYFLNTKYLFFRPHRARNFVPIGGDRESVNQDAMVRLLGFAGNVTMNNAQLQGVLLA